MKIKPTWSWLRAKASVIWTGLCHDAITGNCRKIHGLACTKRCGVGAVGIGSLRKNILAEEAEQNTEYKQKSFHGNATIRTP